jgi:hypothetical protein
MSPVTPSERRWRWVGWGVVLVAAVVALFTARSVAAGWNDGSRFAAIESLGSRGTFAIDESPFANPSPADSDRPPLYPADPTSLREKGTEDKLLIGGRFYSDKPPVLSVLMGGLYRGWLTAGGPPATERPDLFCYLVTVLTSGVGYVVGVWCVWRLGLRVGLEGGWAAGLAAAAAFATVGPAYTWYTNSHLAGFGPAAGLCLAVASAGDRPRWPRLVGIGLLAGLMYATDFALGAALAVALAAYCVPVFGWKSAALVALGTVPFVGLHHALNFAIGGVFLPANTVPEYLAWPGSPHDEQSMTGGLKHSPPGLVVYAADLLFGKKGFLLHNLPLVLTPGGAVLLWVYYRRLRPAVALAGGWAVLGWLAYAAQSTNWSGQCVSVRWFVPLLAPGFWVLALVLRYAPRYRPDFLWFGAWGVAVATGNWSLGAWTPVMPPFYWFLVGPALLGFGVIRLIDSLRPRPAPRASAGSGEMVAPPLSPAENGVN